MWKMGCKKAILSQLPVMSRLMSDVRPSGTSGSQVTACGSLQELCMYGDGEQGCERVQNIWTPHVFRVAFSSSMNVNGIPSHQMTQPCLYLKTCMRSVVVYQLQMHISVKYTENVPICHEECGLFLVRNRINKSACFDLDNPRAAARPVSH